MIIIAKFGGGFWTLIGGQIIKEFVRSILIFFISTWKPQRHFCFQETKPYLRFGLNIAGSRSLEYIYSRSSTFFGGRILGAQLLGFYSLAAQLSLIPKEKIIALINQVAYPVFSKYQNDYTEIKKLYLRLVKLIAFITFPILIGGFFIAELIIPMIFGSKWIPMIFPFKMFCIHQLIVSLTMSNGLVNNAQGRPHWEFYMNIISTLLLPPSFYLAAMNGLNALVIPWATIDPLIRLGFTYITIKKIGILKLEYIKNLKHPFFATAGMISIICIIKYVFFRLYTFYDLEYIIILIIVGSVISYFGYVIAFQRNILIFIWKIRKA